MMLDDKIIIVTGGSGLLGSEMIKDLSGKGAIAINLDINVKENLESGEWYCDITSDDSIRNAVKGIFNYYGRINGLVNNAYPRTSDWGVPFEEVKSETLRRNVDWQMNSCFIFCQEVLKIMRLQKSGSVINVASIYGIVGNDMSLYEGTSVKPVAAYSAIKGGVINLTRHLASLYGQYGVRVNSISPGGIFNDQSQIFVDAYENKVPLKRMGTPRDIAPSVSFLLSDESSYITGHNLVVDGGWTSI
jgi:NAD(P)-dependent dehydrogenase (short-subunit alcohol dehydrogenase family)